MKQIPITTIAAVLLVGCGEAQQSAPAPETKPVEPVAEVPARPSAPPVEAKPVEPVAEVAQPELPTAKAPDIPIWNAAEDGVAPLHVAAGGGHKEVAELLIANGADVNAKVVSGAAQGKTPLDAANETNHPKMADLLRKHGGKTKKELEAAAK